MNTPESVEDYYNQDPEFEWQRLSRHRTEFALILRALREFLPPPPASVIDIGGGPGRYAIELTGQGYQVTLIDLAQENLALARERAREAGVAIHEMIHGNALAMTAVAPAGFDAALVMGPLYHLRRENERRQVLRQARRLLKENGLIFAAFVTRFAVLSRLARDAPETINERLAVMKSLLDIGYDPQARRFANGYFARPEEILPLLEGEGFETRQLLGCEGIAAPYEARINALGSPAWEEWLDLNYRLGLEPSLHGISEHLLYTGQKIDRRHLPPLD